MVSFLALVMFVAGCQGTAGYKNVYSGRTITTVLDSACLVMDDSPALAFSILDRIDSHSIRRRKDNARYALLYTEALYKNYMPIENDSLIMISVRYYSDHKNPEQLFSSFYYLGCIYAQYKCYTDAAVALTQAEKLVDYVDNDFSKGLLYSRMGDVFYDSFDYARAESYYLKAVDLYDKAGKEYYMICALGAVANCEGQMSDFKESNYIYDELIGWACDYDSLSLINQFMINKMANLVFDNDLEGAKLVLDNILSKYGLPEHTPNALFQIAMYYISVQDNVNARKVLDKAWASVPSDSTNLFFAESLLYEKMGKMDSALISYRQSMIRNKTKVVRMLEQPVVGAQRDYYRTLSELEELKARNRVVMLVAAAFIIILIGISFVIYSLYRKRKNNDQIRDYLYAIDELTAKDSLSQETIRNLNNMLREKTVSEQSDRETIVNLNKRIFELSAIESIDKSKITILNSRVKEMLRQQFLPSDYLFTRFYEQLDDRKKAERLYKVVKMQIDSFTGCRNLGRIDSLLYEAYGDLMEKLSSVDLELQEKELLLLRFLLSGFSAKSIAVLLNDTHQNVTQRKKRLFEKIEKKCPMLMRELNFALNS